MALSSRLTNPRTSVPQNDTLGPKAALRLLAELAIIFVGVTLGLLADDWRQERDDREAERVFLAELAEDLVRDSVQLEVALTVAQAWDRTALWSLRVDPDSVTVDEAAQRLRNAQGITFYRPVTSAYASLTEGGNLGLVRDDDLRRRIVEYFEETQPGMSSMSDISQEFFFEFEAALWPHFQSSVSDSATSLFPGEGLRPRGDAGTFWSDPQARQGLENLGRAGAIWAALIPRVLRANSELRQEIAARSES